MISFVLIMVTSIILYIVPQGRVAYWSDWRLWGLSKTQWGNLHINLGVLFLLAIFLHIYYNWKPIVNYLRNKAKQVTVFTKNFNTALVITLAVAVGTYFMLPPFSTILHISESIKDAGAIKYGEPPFGHAELAPLKSLVKKTGLDLESTLNELKTAGIKFDGPDEIFLDIAKKNSTSPQKLFSLIQPEEKHAETTVLPEIPPPGTGSKTLSQLCIEYDLDVDAITNSLRLKKFQIDPDKKLKTLASDNQMSPIKLYDLIKDMDQTMPK